MADIQKALQLMKLFNSYYKSKYGQEFKGNSHADKWGFVDMIDDLTFGGAVDVIEYYFKTKPRSGHSRQHLSYHYHEYAQALEAQEKERAHKRQILRRMKEQYESGD